MATILPKKPRELPRVWKKFWHVEQYDDFFIGKKTYIKTGVVTAEVNVAGLREGARIWVMPWTKVRTAELVRDVRPGGKSSAKVLEEANCRPQK